MSLVVFFVNKWGMKRNRGPSCVCLDVGVHKLAYLSKHMFTSWGFPAHMHAFELLVYVHIPPLFSHSHTPPFSHIHTPPAHTISLLALPLLPSLTPFFCFLTFSFLAVVTFSCFNKQSFCLPSHLPHLLCYSTLYFRSTFVPSLS